MGNVSKTKQFLISGTEIILIAKVEYTAQTVTVNMLVNGALTPVIIAALPISVFQSVTTVMAEIYTWAAAELANGGGHGGGGGGA
jgi:hypothetical protein